MRREDADCGAMWVSPHPLLASHRHYCDGTTLCHDLNSCVQDDWMCTWLHIPMIMTLWIFMDGTIIFALSMVSGMAIICIDCSPTFLCRKYPD